MKVKGIHLSWISVSDFKKSHKFFTEIVGLEVSSLVEEYGWAELKGSQDGMLLGMGKYNENSPIDRDNPVKPGNNAVVTFTVDDIVKKKVDMENKGVVFISDIIEVPGHVKMAFFRDPDNNVFQIVEALDNFK